MQQTRDRKIGAESKTRLVEQIKSVLQSGEYARALDLLKGAGADSAEDTELGELQNLAQDGTARKAEADRLITESQELFARQKSSDAIQLLRKAYELDKKNSLARTILANALVEHAQSLVETDWLESEKLSNQALALNPAHPTAKNILNIIVQKKETSPVDDWVAQASRLHSSGDLFAALAWVAEGLAVHPHDPKLLQIQDAVQRDQETRRRQARRGDLDDLRRLQQEIAGAADAAAKQALVEKIQAIAAKHWTDGEILSIANALLLRLGLVPQESSTAARRKGATVIFHVPRASAPKEASTETSPAPASPAAVSETLAKPVPADIVSVSATSATPVVSGAAAAAVAPKKVEPTVATASAVSAPTKEATAPVEAKKPARAERSVAAAKVEPAPAVVSRPPAKIRSASARTKESGSKSTAVILVCAAVIVVAAAAVFFTRKHQGPEEAKPTAVTPSEPTRVASSPAAPAPVTAAPVAAEPAETMHPAPQTDAATSPDTAGSVPADDRPTVEAGRNRGTLVVVAGQDDARVLLNGKPQKQLTRGGQLRIPNLELKDYVVQVSKNGFQDPARQQIRIRKGEEAKVVFNLQPQPRMSSLTVQGAAPGTAVFVDQSAIGTVQADGTLNIASVNPGDHVIELRKERFKPRQFKKHFVAGGTVSLVAADAALESAGGELKITFSPPDAKVALVKGDLLKIVSSGVPISLDAGTYTLTARTAERFTRSGTVEVVSGQSKSLDLSLAPNGMSKWEDASGWKPEGTAFTRRGGDFVLYGVPPAGTFSFSAIATRGHLLEWVLNYSDAKNYILFQLDENGFHRTVIRNGEKRDEIIVPHKGDKKSFRAVQIRVSAAEIVHQVKDGDSWTVLDRLQLPGVNLGAGKFGFYIPGNDQISVSSFSQYADLNIR